jgi:hypothetical protein
MGISCRVGALDACAREQAIVAQFCVDWQVTENTPVFWNGLDRNQARSSGL